MRPFSGKQKLTIAQRLGPNWQDLADYFDMPPGERQRFQPGREAQGIWEWLESRQRLTQLPKALRYIDRDDLALALEPPACAPAHTTPTGCSRRGAQKCLLEFLSVTVVQRAGHSGMGLNGKTCHAAGHLPWSDA